MITAANAAGSKAVHSHMSLTQLAETIQRVMAGEALADINATPQEQLEAAFERACDFVDREDFDAAIDPLMQLVVQDPYDFRFQFGFGMCLHQLGRTADALKHYSLAYTIDPADPGCVFRIGECFAELGDAKSAADAFETAIALSEPPNTNAEIRLAAEEALREVHA